ncbi:SRPBCC family protein [Leucobacter sp. GX24907]
MTIHVNVDRSTDEPVLQFSLRLAHSPARVWHMLTDPDELSRWYPCRVELEPRVGGRIAFLMDDEAPDESTVTEFAEPQVLAYDWAGERLRWTIDADGAGSVLQLNNSILDPDWMPRTAAGWETCLETLSALLEGDTPVSQAGPDRAKIERYRAQFEADAH